jgi:hypothetical protein
MMICCKKMAPNGSVSLTRARRMATACSHIEKWPSVQVKPMGVCSHDFVKLDLCSLSLSHISQERLQQMD